MHQVEHFDEPDDEADDSYDVEYLFESWRHRQVGVDSPDEQATDGDDKQYCEYRHKLFFIKVI